VQTITPPPARLGRRHGATTPAAMAFYGAIVTALFQREKTGKGSHVSDQSDGQRRSGPMACWAQAKLAGAKFKKRKPREEALNARDQPLQVRRRPAGLILSLLNEDRQWPTLGALAWAARTWLPIRASPPSRTAMRARSS